jgi:hypothetical protein
MVIIGEMMNVTETSHIFTFGFVHRHPVTNASLANCYVNVAGEYETARARMLASVFGRNWAFQYVSLDDAGVSRFAMTEVELPDRVAIEQLTYHDAIRRAEQLGHI